MKILDGKALAKAKAFAKKRPGESSAEYQERLLWAMRREENQRPLTQGSVARPKGPADWRESAQQVGTAPLTPEEQQEAEAAVAVPLGPKRTGQERVDQMIRMFVDEAERCYQSLGYVEFPRSLMDDIGVELWKLGLPEVRHELENYAKRLMERINAKNPNPRDLTPNVGVNGAK